MAVIKTLDTPYNASGVVYTQALTSFAMTVAEGQVHIGYAALDENGEAILSDIPVTLTGQEVADFIARVNQIASNPLYTAIQAFQAACLENIPGSGTLELT